MKLKELRLKQGLTQNELGKTIGVSGQTILNWENGIYEPKINQLISLADFFNVSVDELVERPKQVSDIERGINALSLIDGKELIDWIKGRLHEMEHKAK